MASDVGQLRGEMVKVEEDINKKEVLPPPAGLVAANVATTGGGGTFTLPKHYSRGR